MKYAFNFYCLGGGRKGNSGWKCLTDIWKCSGKESSQPVWADHPPSWGLWIRISNVWSEPPNLHFVACALCPVCCLHRRVCSIIWEQWFELRLDFPSVSSSIYETGPSSPGCPIWSCSPGFWWTQPPLLDHLCLQHIPILSREERTTSPYLLPCSSPCGSLCGLSRGSSYKWREGRMGFSHQPGWFSASLWLWGTVQWVSTGGAECKHRRRQLCCEELSLHMSQEATDGTGWRDGMRRDETIFINMIDSSLSAWVAKTLSRVFLGIAGGVLELSWTEKWFYRCLQEDGPRYERENGGAQDRAEISFKFE